MAPTHHRKLKTILFSLNTTQFECQVQTWNLDPGIGEGERMYSFCPDGSFVEDAEPEGVLEMTFYADWRSDGINDFLMSNSGQVADFTLDHHPDIAAEHVRWIGKVRLAAPPVGGEARATEMTEVSLQIIGNVTDGYSRVGV